MILFRKLTLRWTRCIKMKHWCLQPDTKALQYYSFYRLLYSFRPWYFTVVLTLQHIFMWEQDEYNKEGIDWTGVTFADNKPVLVSSPVFDFFIACRLAWSNLAWSLPVYALCNYSVGFKYDCGVFHRPQDLFFNKPIGLLALLDEESHFPQVCAASFTRVCA